MIIALTFWSSVALVLGLGKQVQDPGVCGVSGVDRVVDKAEVVASKKVRKDHEKQGQNV